MNIALIGYGKMGHEIERLCVQRKNVAIRQIFTGKNNPRAKGPTKGALKGIDVCIDFSTPKSVLRHIKAAASCSVNIVVGTTGWYGEMARVRKIVEKANIGLLYSPNFSIGMNIFYEVLASASRLMNGYEVYDVAIHETHHRAKADSPSGTALALAEVILKNLRRKKTIVSNQSRNDVRDTWLQVTSSRVGSIAGIHNIIFDSPADSIELIHAAKDRSGFALGALVAAEWLKGKKGVYTMKDVMA